MGKRPASMFYWMDFDRDTRALSLAAIGAWMRIMGQLHFSEIRGKKRQAIKSWANVIGCTEKEIDNIIDDVVEAVLRTNDQPAEPDPNYDGATPDPSRSSAPWRVFNIGCEQPVQLLRYIEVIEECTGKKAIKNMLPEQPGDMKATHADVSALVEAVGYRPKISLEAGMERFVRWYREFYEN